MPWRIRYEEIDIKKDDELRSSPGTRFEVEVERTCHVIQDLLASWQSSGGVT